MEYQSAEKVLSELKQQKVYSVYLLQGDEPFFIDRISNYIEDHLLSESEKAFNLSTLYGRDVDAKQVLDHARQYPMMSERRLVLLKEAQGMRDIKSLESYISAPSPHTVFVVAYKKKIDGRIKWVKDAKKSEHVVFFTSSVIPEYKLNSWIDNYVKNQNLKITPEAVEMLAKHLGNDLKKVTNEIEKIKLNLGSNKIESKHIEKYIGISKDFDIYALLKALSEGDISLVHQITYNLEKNNKDQPLQRIIPGIAGYFERVLIVAQHFRKDDRTLGTMIGTYPSFIKEYRQAAKRFGYNGLIESYKEIVIADGMSKGLERRNSQGILRELVGKMVLLSN